MTLEQQLAAVATKHDLTCLTISAYVREDGTVWFGSYANVTGMCGSAPTGGPATLTVTNAVVAAIADLNARRTADVVLDAMLPEGLAA